MSAKLDDPLVALCSVALARRARVLVGLAAVGLALSPGASVVLGLVASLRWVRGFTSLYIVTLLSPCVSALPCVLARWCSSVLSTFVQRCRRRCWMDSRPSCSLGCACCAPALDVHLTVVQCFVFLFRSPCRFSPLWFFPRCSFQVEFVQ